VEDIKRTKSISNPLLQPIREDIILIEGAIEKRGNSCLAKDSVEEVALLERSVKLFDEMEHCKTIIELNLFCSLMVRPFVKDYPDKRKWLLDRYATVKWLIELPEVKIEDVLNKEGLKYVDRANNAQDRKADRNQV
jgi:hypothetical protein